MNNFKAAFDKKFPKAWSRVADFYGNGSEVMWSGEDSYNSDGLPLFDYYRDDNLYECGILKEVVDFAEQHGFYFECYDAGTFVAHKI